MSFNPSPLSPLPQGEGNKPLIVIVGPTAVGKTEIAIQLAEQLNGEIVSADSRLFYRGMDIGTAKPTLVERTRIQHHLIDVAEPDQTWSLAMFQEAASKIIAEIHARNHLPFLVGGTGQYITAVTQGWTPPAVEPDPRLRDILEKMDRENSTDSTYWLCDRLKMLDPSSAARIDPRNRRRVVRAMEVILTTGRPFSDQRARSGSPYRLITIGLMRPRKELYDRVDARIDAMFANGFIDEVKSLIEKGYSPTLPTMSAIGYRECVAVIEGRMTLAEAKMQMKKITRVFVRRQANWFKENDPAIKWFTMRENIADEITSFIKEALK